MCLCFQVSHADLEFQNGDATCRWSTWSTWSTCHGKFWEVTEWRVRTQQFQDSIWDMAGKIGILWNLAAKLQLSTHTGAGCVWWQRLWLRRWQLVHVSVAQVLAEIENVGNVFGMYVTMSISKFQRQNTKKAPKKAPSGPMRKSIAVWRHVRWTANGLWSP